MTQLINNIQIRLLLLTNDHHTISDHDYHNIHIYHRLSLNYDIYFVNPIYWSSFYSRIREIDQGHERLRAYLKLI